MDRVSVSKVPVSELVMCSIASLSALAVLLLHESLLLLVMLRHQLPLPLIHALGGRAAVQAEPKDSRHVPHDQAVGTCTCICTCTRVRTAAAAIGRIGWCRGRRGRGRRGRGRGSRGYYWMRGHHFRIGDMNSMGQRRRGAQLGKHHEEEVRERGAEEGAVDI